ncbi:MAG: TonB-dependent receptor [Gammaproteobacteria bacterium]|nr:TonB-dependent receptor [Gammaproteobacteria bacterium]MDH4314053.1 TonB-dependent receptor [Gammaproteobacteria bacterium]MDH5213507.1 TonB-dependent receptor [Gammaproteobacteria bacterium]
MNNNSKPARPSHRSFGHAFFATLALLALSVAGFAQETTSAVRGTISGPDGAPAAGATVTVVDLRTGTRRSAVTSSSGQFSVSGLRVGGPYNVEIQSSQYAGQTVTDVYLGLGDTFTFDLALAADSVEEIVVTATAIKSAQVALGPANTFDIQTLQEAPAINRDLADVVRLDPRVYVDEADVNGLQCAGASSRFNSLTVDGVKMNDNFGLNRSGYPTERMPFPYDAIEQVSVELAPFDVQYGGFTACNFNAVTKSGTNEFHGSVFFDYTDDSLSGDTLEGDPIDLGVFDEKRYGFSIGGPIISDKLFFFAAYEKLEGANTYSRGPAGTAVGAPVAGTSVAQANEIARIARELYGYEPGAFETALPVEDEKYLIKLDWEINDQHRAALTHNWNDGFNISESDSSSGQLEFSNHRYERGAELTATALQLFSNWNDSFSTEVRVSKGKLDNRQIPRGGVDFGEVQVLTFNDDDNDGVFSSATVYLGADDSRHANKLNYDVVNYKIAGSYSLDDHVITGGWERDEFSVFNLFIQEAELEIRFNNSCNDANPNGCIHAFEAGTPERIIYENAAPSNVKEDAGANFGYEINSLYVQDEFPIADGNVTVVAGVRYDWYTSSDVPTANPLFEQRYGFSNSKNFDGEGLIQPRLGINWDVNDRLAVHGGAGLYSGGNPNVWLSNNYSNNGITQVEVSDRNLDNANPCGPMIRLPNGDPDPNAAPCPLTLFNIPTSGAGRPIYDIPQNLIDAVANGTADSGVNAIDPNFKIPSQWKFNVGMNWELDLGFMGDGYALAADYIYTKSQDSAITLDAALAQVGTAADGRPLYRAVDFLDPDCATDPGNSAVCPSRFQQDLILANVSGSDADANVFSVSVAKSHEDIGIDWSLAYAYTDSTDVSPMTSSTAGSNFGNVALSDPNNPSRADSNYVIPHRFTGRFSFRKDFFGDNTTRFTLYGSRNQGIPYSYVYSTGNAFGDSSFSQRHLLYVPTGPSDPNVVFGGGFDQTAFFNFVNSSGLSEYAGSIAPRNVFNSSWWTKFDLRIEQELPGFGEDHHFAGFLLIENLGNLLNDDWGVHREVTFPRAEGVVGLGGVSPTGQLLYNSFTQPGGEGRSQDASLWEIRFGIRYDF